MPSSSISVTFAGFFLILMLLWSNCLYANGCFTSIISFGDSLADTGNLKHLASTVYHRQFAFFSPPYGESFINQSTGRCSNGRLIIDFLAESLGLPLVPPFLQENGSNNAMTFKQGVNYAVSGATTLNSSVLKALGTVDTTTNASLGVQLAWFKQSLPSICGNPSNCRKFIESSLILVGEIGENDYNYQLLDGKPIKESESSVPLVVGTIVSTINELIEMGAKTLVVPGSLPLGCIAAYLSAYGSEDEEYDPITGCLIRVNQFSEFHNKLLQTKLNQVQDLHPNVNIIYADYYNAAMPIYRFPYKFGFTNGALKVCCGGGGRECGAASAPVCDDPGTYACWDGLHLTEAAYRIIARNLFSMPQFDSLCSSLTSLSGVGLSLCLYKQSN